MLIEGRPHKPRPREGWEGEVNLTMTTQGRVKSRRRRAKVIISRRGKMGNGKRKNAMT